ncbi:MAG TPA: hypothetical protein VMS45_11265, partial [Gemmatimonadaceae bacterium]|nr:hypothetical protein [Gemmatimonadaceae bacterium]
MRDVCGRSYAKRSTTITAPERATQTHLRVERIDAERHLIYIRGAVPGPKTGLVMVRKQG